MDSLLIALLVGLLSLFGLGGTTRHVVVDSGEGVLRGETPEYLEDPGADDPVLTQWLDREVLPDCGVFDPDLVVVRETDLVGWECLEVARANGLGGEMVIQFLTQEGDPITVFHRITPDGIYEKYTDSTLDNFGSGRWEYSKCLHPSKKLDRQRCLD